MRTDIPRVNSRGFITVMGVVMDTADEVARDIPFPNEQARHEWIESHFNELLRRGAQKFMASKSMAMPSYFAPSS